MMAFTCNDIPRFAFGFYNPNHAAAMICAVMASRWGNRTSRVTCDRAGVTVSREDRSYDKYGRLAAHTRGKLKETYAYDHFGRLVEKDENGLIYTYAYDAYGSRTSRTVRSPAGETTEERRSYDKYGRLVEIASFGTSVKYRYDAKGRIARQTVDGSPIDFAYTKYGQLAGKYLGGREKPDASVEYEYSKSGQIVARTANGVRQTYEYDGRGQLLAVKENGVHVERYAYDKAGNMTKKALLRRGHADSTKPPTLADYIVTTFAFDGANQLVSSTTDGVTTQYAYDAAGRLVKEGGKTYRYGYLDKVLSVTEGERKYTYDYHVDGQLARADYGNGKTEDFGWDGLALIRRGDERFVNEPHVGGGNPVASSKGTKYFNDILGTTVGAKKGAKYSAAALTAFGETIENGGVRSTPTPSTYTSFYTGKPEVAGLGHAFLFRNYRASLAKWQTADPLGYPDGWNQLAYCGNGVVAFLDVYGCVTVSSIIDALNQYAHGNGESVAIANSVLLQSVGSDGYGEMIREVNSKLAGVDKGRTSGSFDFSDSFSWYQGLVLGGNNMLFTVSVSWFASEWYWDGGRYCRDVIGSGWVYLSTTDRWDFDEHPDKGKFWNLVFEEWQEGIAELYSYIMNGGEAAHGTPFDMAGRICKGPEDFRAKQYKE